ncbi:hypothetical protein RDV64_02390 [Acuticoccus sp. MNP-M23]|uniref:DUF6732 family protein n=1 Tax=Acuticoccus sp. MNP-M23 TaxID=3072793 RepID=UPI0028157332|nr:DUF6732 family protein [Acuticoccus sp. MNP-M23]WMS43273.1 hypothetical protein RDV64_02390 [Acuticoccus sp. MNP-M23]
MRTTLAATAALVPAAAMALLAGPASAHPGHIAQSSGHDHIIVLVAGVGLCLCAAGAALLVRGRRDR